MVIPEPIQLFGSIIGGALVTKLTPVKMSEWKRFALVLLFALVNALTMELFFSGR